MTLFSGGFVANSLAVMNDALHQFFDLNSLLMSLVATWIARWKPNEKKTFGYYRAGKNDVFTLTSISLIRSSLRGLCLGHATFFMKMLRDRNII